jgi:hypothetical protein
MSTATLVPPTSDVHNVLKAMRRTRRTRRVKDLEWFEVLYQVYLVALIGGGIVLWLSSYVKDGALDASTIAQVQADAPVWIGLIAAIAVAIGLRSGAHGGPMAIEEPEVRYVLLAPIRLRTALLMPAYQRIRSATFAGVLIGALAGLLLGRRLPGKVFEWVLSDGGAGAVIALAAVGAALLGHASRRKQWELTGIASVLLVLQGLAVADIIPVGPFDTVGSLAIWPLRVNPVDLLAPVVALALAGVGMLLLDRMSVEQIDRRSSLVAQLRFAVTMQDLRTVTLLRRQLSNELPRRDPWFKVDPGRFPAWRRSWRSLARFPSKRLGRMALLAAFAGAAELAAFKGTSPAILLAGAATFLLGLDAVEPFAQELDHPELTERYPMEGPRLQQRLLGAPAILLVVASLIGALAAFLLDRNLSTLAIGAMLAPPAALAGGIAAAFNTASGAPDPLRQTAEQSLLPPEVAGMKYALKALLPFAIAVLGCAPVLIVRVGIDHDIDPLASALRSAVFVLVVVAALTWWLERRQVLRRWWDRVVEEGRGSMKGQP